ncbi:S-adenosylmethionine mitochondrial carrier protein homolog isoform X2 [Anabrus simplex]|uniref:S-adenosylmethionine mitochondrial carrier protein homolog isoform X2 n=1 Tax=Anabrus simplex TaxID=316456 RepID=UPI0035A354B6
MCLSGWCEFQIDEDQGLVGFFRFHVLLELRNLGPTYQPRTYMYTENHLLNCIVQSQAALFFCSYNTVKGYFHTNTNDVYQPVVHIVAASVAEVVSCLVKVPTEILKQRQQVGIYSSDILKSCSKIYSENGIRGFYRGLSSTILREIPFSIIQFPIWEFLMARMGHRKKRELSPADKALCGAIAGGIAAALTTPVDVVKTRVMLSEKNSFNNGRERKMLAVLKRIYFHEGVQGLFAGFVPRTMWITLGGAIFFGSYELSKDTLSQLL